MRRVDPTPFEPWMPTAVRHVVEDARRGEGPAVEWLSGDPSGWGQVGEAFGLLRGQPEPLEPEVVGWLVGIAMFEDDLHALPEVMEREGHTAPAAFAVAAFAAGLAAGMPTTKRQWKSVEKLVELAGAVPDALLGALPQGLASSSALDRGVALRLLQQRPDAIDGVRRAAAAEPDRKRAKRLHDALATLAAEPSAPDDGRLARLLDGWATSRAPAVAEALERAGGSVGRPAIQGRSKAELEVAWHAVAAARDPADVHRLLGAPWPGPWKTALERVEALARFPDDPRVALALVDTASRYPSIGSSPLHQALAALVGRICDPRCADGLDRLAMAREEDETVYAQAAAGCRSVVPGAVPAALAADIAATERDQPDLAALWDAVYADPDDAAARLVLADALQSAGDPRGELIALQEAEANGTAPSAVRKRIRALLDAHIDAWTGPIPGVRRASRVFRRGLLTQLEIRGADALAATAEEPVLRGIRRIAIDGWGGEAAAPVLHRMAKLDELVVHTWSLEKLAAEHVFRGVRIVGIAADELPVSAFPDAQWLLASWAAEHGSPPDEVERRVRAAHAAGLGVALVGVRDAHVPDLVRRLAGLPGRTVLELGANDVVLDRRGWRITLDGPVPVVGHVGTRWALEGARRVLLCLAETGHIAAEVVLQGSDASLSALAAVLPGSVSLRTGAFTL